MDAASTESKGRVDISRILEMIPHRYPFLLLDRVIEVTPDVGAIGLKNVSFNEPFFQGHFPREPVMPGVLLVECMAQTAAIVVVETLGPAAEGKLVYFMSVEYARFRRPVIPGDQLHIHVDKTARRRNVWKFKSVIKVDDKVVAEAVISAMIRDV